MVSTVPAPVPDVIFLGEVVKTSAAPAPRSRPASDVLFIE
jgi:hypothetical protein